MRNLELGKWAVEVADNEFLLAGVRRVMDGQFLDRIFPAKRQYLVELYGRPIPKIRSQLAKISYGFKIRMDQERI